MFRSVGVVEKDLKALLECLLLSNGFTKANKLSALLLGCLLHLKVIGYEHTCKYIVYMYMHNM